MAKQQSLAARTGAVAEAPEFSLPAVFQAPQQPVEARKWPPYIAFIHGKRADEWKRVMAKFPQAQEGDMYLIRSDSVVPLSPAKLGWVCHKQYWASASAAGEVQAVSFKEQPHPFKEHVEAVVLCYLENEALFANIQFRTTKCPAAKTLSDALAEAATPDWANKGQAHKDTLICTQAFMRFYGVVSLNAPRPSKSGGQPYKTTACEVYPTTHSEWLLLKALQEREDFKDSMAKAADRFEWRIKELEKKLVK